ncbi:carotenoid biosynthesis protein [Marinilabilia rubra]|uniref:Carotenoid biosynthesis protein n=1 Tax=Marinilabilia rubra TaxID=2162893 RepID=A0A2U2B579_9BACT|nr:carotenoid biosynthesis protein [Marinilabilia rubra]PWD98194.1 carotenoid biosynthesis protein [Marinilabilia rubra]
MRDQISNFTKKHINSSKINRFWIIYYAVGVAGFAIPYSRELFTNLIGLSIFMSIVLLFLFHKKWDAGFIISSLFVFLGGFFIEAIGVSSGIIFGEYQYGEALGPKIFHTPVLIGLNWWMLIYIIWQIVQKAVTDTPTQLLLGATIMTGYDVFLEPIAMATNMWGWKGQIVPVQNYLAWFIISFIFFSIFKVSKNSYNNPVAERLIVSQIAFFVLLNLINQTTGL